jgi:hypothetical protein
MLSPRLFSPPGINYLLVRPTLSSVSVTASLQCGIFYLSIHAALLPGAIIFFFLARLRLKIKFRGDREEARLGVMELADEQLRVTQTSLPHNVRPVAPHPVYLY